MVKNQLLETKNFVWLPNENQESLLKAGLIEDSSAIIAWKNWKKSFSSEKLNEAESRLFPLVYHNLTNQNYSDEFTPILKQHHRNSFKNTQIKLAITKKLIKTLNENNIRTILLKGTALSFIYYESVALRPMSDIDLLIKPDDFLKAIETLKAEGWESLEKNPAELRQIIHSTEFRNSDGEELDLHWRLMRDCWHADQNELFWKEAVSVKLNNLTTETLCATDHLFHICSHGSRYNPFSPIRWIPDALMILRSSQSIDWQRLYELGKLYRLNLNLFHTLSFLKQIFDAPIPHEFLEKVRNVQKTRLEKMSFRLFSQLPKAWTIKRFVQEAAFQYSTQTSSTNLKPRSLAFFNYLRHFLTIEKITKKLSKPKV